MYNLTAAQRELFMNNRQVVRITFNSVADSTVLTEENIKSGGLVIDSYSLSGDAIEFGSVISSELQLTINNKSGEFNDVTFEGAECFVEVGTKDWSDESAQIVYIPMGYYTVEGSPRKLDTISFTALDRMVKFDRTADFTQITFPISTMALAQRIGVLCGVTVEATSLPSSMRDFSVTAAPEGDNITYRQLLSWIAQINGGCFVVGRDGKVYYRWYGVEQSQQGVSLPASVRYSSDIDENTITLSGIRIVYNGSATLQGTDDYAMTVEGNMLIQSVAQVNSVKQFIYENRIYNNASLTYYTPFTATVKSMPFVDLFDRVYYVKGETQIPTYITGFNFALNNSTVLEGNGKTTKEKSYAELNPMTTQQVVVLDKLHNKTVQEFKAADGELLSKIANATSKYDETGSPGTITLRGYDLPADAGYPAASHNGEYYLNETNGYVYLSNGTTWSKVAELDLITDEIESSIVQTASEIALSVAESSVNYSKNKLAPTKYTSEPNNSSNVTLTDSTGTVAFTATGTWAGYSWSGDSLGLIEGHTYVVTCTNNTANAVGRIAYRGGDNVIKASVALSSTGAKSFEFTFDDVDGYISVLATNNSTTTGSVSVTNLMVRDKTIEDSTFKPCADDAKYICSQISLTPEQIVLDSGRLVITAGNFQLDQNGTVTLTGGVIKTSNYAAASGSTKTVGGKINLNATGSTLMIDTANFKITGGGAVTATDITLTGGTIKTSNYTAASGDTKTVGGKLNLSATGATLLLDTANFKITGGGAVTAEDATFTNCTINGGTFTVVTSGVGQQSQIMLTNNTGEDSFDQIDMKAGILNVLRQYSTYSSYTMIRGGTIKVSTNQASSPSTELEPNQISTDFITVRNITLERSGTLIPQINVENLGPILYVYPTTYLLYFGNPDLELKLYGSKTTVNDKNIATSPEVVARLEATVGHSGKNQLSFGSQSLTRVIAGVTFTVDPVAGTVTANGTSTSSSGSQYNIRITGNQVPDGVANRPSRSISNGKYYFCGCPSGGSVEKASYNVYIWDHTTGTRAKRWNGSTNVDTDYGVKTKNELLINDQSHTLTINIRVYNTNNQDVVFRPMIWSGDIDDDTFEPYIEPTDNQIETKTRAYLNSSLGHVTKNLFNLSGHNAIPSGLTISTEDVATGRLVASATGAWKGIGWSEETLNLDPNKRYTITLTNNLANSIGRLCKRDLTNNISTTIINLNTTGDKEYSFIPAVDFASNYRLELFCTFSSNSSATGSIDISNFMIREASISDDTFEPYQIPTDERIALLEARIAALEART